MKRKFLLLLLLPLLYFASCDKAKESQTVSEMAVAADGEVSELRLAEVPPIESEGQQTSNEFKKLTENSYMSTSVEPLSTFSIDVDNASYAVVRQYIQQQNSFPDPDAIRIEELINAFSYNYPKPELDKPLTVSSEVMVCPWEKDHQLLKLSMKAKEIDYNSAPANNLVFLIDVSGSMDEENKLPLVKEGLKLLTANLRPIDKISIVVYAGAAGLVLDATSGEYKSKIYSAIEQLQSGGSTAGGEGLVLAYATAKKHFLKNGNNRIILCSDGDFNVGATSETEIEELIESKRKEGVYISVLGFGMGNYKDDRMELLADKGNGNYAYIDNLNEAKKRLVGQMGGMLYTVAKDVKFQVEFNPFKVEQYRLIGYENRMLNNEDFVDDKKDAGELGAGHTVTALYELIPINPNSKQPKIKRKYSTLNPNQNLSNSNELATVSVRYKEPKEEESKELTWAIPNQVNTVETASSDMQFCSAVASFGQLLRHSKYKGTASFSSIKKLAESSSDDKPNPERSEFMELLTWCIKNEADFNKRTQ
jgi:Ca-activated chloride channel family protein